MKNGFLFFLLCVLVWVPCDVSAQCTPVNCLDQLPSYGGVCNTSVKNGVVNREYYDIASFHITTECVDAGKWDSAYVGVRAQMLKLHTFSCTGLPAGLTMQTSQNEYAAPANGCGGISGIPEEAGLFKVKLAAMVNIRIWLLSSSCSGLLSLDIKNQSFEGTFSMTILPDANFTGPDTVCCIGDPTVTLIPSVTAGGKFSGPGVSGNIFNPSLAGAGTHQIRYEVTVQQGTAVSPAKNSSVQTIKVLPLKTWFADYDKDGFGNLLVNTKACSGLPGYVENSLDCNDADSKIHPGAIDFPGNGLDEDCNGSDGLPSAIQQVTDGKFKLFPNPVKDFLVLECPVEFKHYKIWILTSNGTLMLEKSLTGNGRMLDVRNWAKGIYLVLVTDMNSTFFTKIIKE